MKLLLLLSVFLGCVSVAFAGDPASSWLSYASWSSNGAPISALNATWKVPSMPSVLTGSNAPGWWFGIQTADGNGALIQPILAFADGDPVYTIFNGVFDWNDGSWFQSESSQVQPGQTIFASVTLDQSSNVYTMFITCIETGWSVSSTKQVISGQVETVAYFVLEHQPDSCSAYPSDGGMSFTDIVVEVSGKRVTPQWEPQIGVNACNSAAKIVSPSEIAFSWDVSATSMDDQEIIPVKHTTFHDDNNQ